jgi:hypothetical protein
MDLLGVDLELGNQIEVGDLNVFPLLGSGPPRVSYLSGPEAIGTGLIEVSELNRPEVSSLLVKNVSSLPVLLLEGEMLIGINQNRTMNVTVLCPPMTTTMVPVSCVEEGRWRAKGRGAVADKRRVASGSLRSAKTSHLEARGDDPTRRTSKQSVIWESVRRYGAAHGVRLSDSVALDEVQEHVEELLRDELSRVKAQSHQVGVVCALGDRVLGMDLFDNPDTLDLYLRPIIAGHALDATDRRGAANPLGAVQEFLGLVNDCEMESGAGVGLGNEILLRGPVVGIGLHYEGSLVHLAAYPAQTNSTQQDA